MPDYADLIARLETATEGSRLLDAQIGILIASPYYNDNRPCWTTSLDAALTLVPEGWFFTLMHVAPDFIGEGQRAFQAEIHGPVSWIAPEQACPEEPVCDCVTAGADTPALALCIAALKARGAA